MGSNITRSVAALVWLLALFAPMTANAKLLGTTIETSGDTFVVEVNEGKLIRLDRDIASVFIANPAFADVSVKSTKLLYVFGKTPGETTLYAIDGNENIIANIKVVVHHNLSRLQEAMDQLVGPSAVTASSIDGSILLTGDVPLATHAANAVELATGFIVEGQNIINRINVTAPNQINIRVRFAEISRDIVNELGFDFFAAADSGFNFALSSLSPVAAAAATASFTNIDAGPLDLNTFLDALATDSLASILAEPNLTAVSGETASFLAGGEFPIPIAQDNDTGIITVSFKEFGVSLSFTPTIISNDRISMHVRPEVSALSTDGAVALTNISIPALTTRRAETTIELASGQSFAIAGLILDQTTQTASKFPGLGDIPILGTLFQSDQFQRNETELVIVVTPYVVMPVSPDQISLPTTPHQQRQLETPMPDPAAASLQTIPLQSGAAANGQTAPAGFIIE